MSSDSYWTAEDFVDAIAEALARHPELRVEATSLGDELLIVRPRSSFRSERLTQTAVARISLREDDR